MSETIPLCAPQDFFSEDYIRLCDWMQARYGMPWRLGSCISLVYARIYEATRHGVGIFCEPQAHLAELVGHSRRQVNQCLKRLEELGLVEVVGVVGHPRTGIRAYRVLAGPVNRAIQTRNDEVAQRASSRQSQDVVDLGGVSPCAPAAEAKRPPSTAAQSDAPSSPAQPLGPAGDSTGSSGRDEHSDQQEPLTPEEHKSFEQLAKRYRKPCRGGYLKEAARAYAELIEEGYSPEEIDEALDAYLSDFFSSARPRDQKSQRYLMSLNRWLSEGSGCRYWLSLLSSSSGPSDRPEGKQRTWSYSRYKSGAERGWIASNGSQVLVLDVKSDDPGEAELAEALEAALSQERRVS